MPWTDAADELTATALDNPKLAEPSKLPMSDMSRECLPRSESRKRLPVSSKKLHHLGFGVHGGEGLEIVKLPHAELETRSLEGCHPQSLRVVAAWDNPR